MFIRRAQQADTAAIAAIWNAEIRSGISTFNTLEKSDRDITQLIINRKEAVQVAVEEGEIIGFATYFPFRAGVGYQFSKEHTIYLDDAARGKGAGRALMLEIERLATAEGVHSLMAGIAGENEAGIAFHTAMGFEHVARIPEVGYKFGRWMDLILMQKFLQRPTKDAAPAAEDET
ncbi:GNAT family N-acetyltransferase [Cognatishimia sp. SS12]|uniref:GNAT family N-acetyltransferase n=1 Tax=Cognatishimia sp. SS12 TaxID=2979465 RepID=UPI00232CEA47|nr:GNAT family N-acetyltransferase [Cognatishimia sp. SS12]MDC0738587.1 GNAT family N-acetyltransferase [Cognatishimia sp. SS12]